MKKEKGREQTYTKWKVDGLRGHTYVKRAETRFPLSI